MPPVPQTSALDTFLSNMTEVSTSRIPRGGQTLKPVLEAPPTMWAIQHGWAPFPPARASLAGGSARPSATVLTADGRVRAAQHALMSLMMIIAAGTADLGVSEAIPSSTTRAWCTFIATFARLIFESPLEKTSIGANDVIVSENMIAELIDWSDELRAYLSNAAGHKDAAEVTTMGNNVATRFRLPPYNLVNNTILAGVLARDVEKESPAYYALIVYMSGRALTAQTEVAVQQTRPKNLQQKFNEGAIWSTIGGDAKMSKGAYKHLAKAWLMNITMRIGLLVPLISLEAGEAYVTGNIIYTMFKLLRGAGMAHVGIIFEFLRRYPWVAEMESLQGEMYLLALHSVSLKKAETRLQPYFKLLYADSTNFFDSKSLTRLTALAVTILGRTSTTLLNYAHVSDPALVTEFDDELAKFKADE